MTTYLIYLLSLIVFTTIVVFLYWYLDDTGKIKISAIEHIWITIIIILIVSSVAMGINGFLYDNNQKVEKYKILAVMPGRMRDVAIDFYGTTLTVNISNMENEINKILGRQVIPGDEFWMYYCEDLYMNKYFRVTNVATAKQWERMPVR